MMRLVLWAAVIGGGVWLGRRLWPAIRSEPSTWLGENWREIVREKAGV
jgi:hypothetical protein